MTRPPTPGRRRAPRDEGGVTLIELLVVLALIATLMGIGISMYTNLGKQGVFTASLGRLLSTMNRVRNSSMTHTAALQVTAGDPEKGEENSARGLEFVPLFQTQCEPPVPPETLLLGALDRNGTLPPNPVFKEGVIGKALFFEAGGAVDCGNHPAYDATEGVSVDVWVWPSVASTGTVVRRGESLGLYVLRDAEGGLGIRFELGFASGLPGSGDPAGKPESVIVERRTFEVPGALPLRRWSRILATYDREAVTIAVDMGRGPVERLRKKEKARLAPTRNANLFLGGGGGDASSFRGGIDDVRIEGVLGEAYEPFPPQVLVEPPTRRIYFLGGKLDPARHTRPETVVLTYGRRRREIVIGLEGNVISK